MAFALEVRIDLVPVLNLRKRAQLYHLIAHTLQVLVRCIE